MCCDSVMAPRLRSGHGPPQPRCASHYPNRSANVLGLSELRATTPAHGTTIGQPLSLCTGVLFVTVPAPVFVDRWTTLHTHTHQSPGYTD